jgi:hypothetical protein
MERDSNPRPPAIATLPFLRMMGYHDRLFLSTYRRQDDQWDFSPPFCR